MAKKTKATRLDGKATVNKGDSTQGNFDESFDHPSVPELDALAGQYCKQRDARLALGKKEVEARLALEEEMKKREFTGYRFTNKKGVLLIVTIEPGVDKASVKPDPAARTKEAIEQGDD